jgi:hypothetical protein
VTRSNPARNGLPDLWRRRLGRVVGAVAFTLTPWLSLGYGTPIAFMLVAGMFSHLGKVQATVLWLSAAVYTAAVIVEVAAVDAAPGTTGEYVFYICLVITIVGGGLQAFAFTIVAAVNGYRPGGSKALHKTLPRDEAPLEALNVAEGSARGMVTPADLEGMMTGLWVIYPSRLTFLGAERFRRRPMSHIVFDGPGWRLYKTGWRWRLEHAVGISQGSWRIVDLDGQALLVLTVRSSRPSAASQAMLESNYGYSGGAMIVISATTRRDEDAVRMRDGQALMYFLPVQLRSHEIILALPSNGSQGPRQRWVRVQEENHDLLIRLAKKR